MWYIDDFIWAPQTFDDNLVMLREVFDCKTAAGFKIKLFQFVKIEEKYRETTIKAKGTQFKEDALNKVQN